MPKKKIIIKKKNHRSLKGILVLFKAPRSCAASTLCFGMASFGVHFSRSSSKASAALAKGLPVPRSSMARRLPGHSPRSVPQKGHGTIWEAPGRGRGFLPPQYKVSAHHSCPNPGPVQPKNSRRSTRNFISVSYALPEVVPLSPGWLLRHPGDHPEPQTAPGPFAPLPLPPEAARRPLPSQPGLSIPWELRTKPSGKPGAEAPPKLYVPVGFGDSPAAGSILPVAPRTARPKGRSPTPETPRRRGQPNRRAVIPARDG